MNKCITCECSPEKREATVPCYIIGNAVISPPLVVEDSNCTVRCHRAQEITHGHSEGIKLLIIMQVVYHGMSLKHSLHRAAPKNCELKLQLPLRLAVLARCCKAMGGN
jgi:hypothetical protein